MPAIRLVNVSSVVTINTSLCSIEIKSGKKISTRETIEQHVVKWIAFKLIRKVHSIAIVMKNFNMLRDGVF